MGFMTRAKFLINAIPVRIYEAVTTGESDCKDTSSNAIVIADIVDVFLWPSILL